MTTKGKTFNHKRYCFGRMQISTMCRQALPHIFFSFSSLAFFGILMIIPGILADASPLLPQPTLVEANDTLPSTTPTASSVEDNAMNTTPSTTVLECFSESDHLLKFVLNTRRNSTGHWIADMDVRPGASRFAGEDHPFEVQLEHRTRTCTACEDPSDSCTRVSLHVPPTLKVPSAGGYRYFPGFGFYKRHLELKNWHEARAACQAEGADLVVIDSVAEAQLLLELSAPLLFLQPSDKWNAEAYVGIFDFHHESHFTTVRGQLLEDTGYVKWNPGEPNNHREEDCVTIVRNAMYNDVGCSKTFEFICELEE